MLEKKIRVHHWCTPSSFPCEEEARFADCYSRKALLTNRGFRPCKPEEIPDLIVTFESDYTPGWNPLVLKVYLKKIC